MQNLKRYLAASVVVFACAIANGAVKSDSGAAEKQAEREKALDAAAYINHINYLYHVMDTYNDKLILRKEFDRLSLKELNLPAIPEIHSDNGEKVLGTLRKAAKSLEDLCLAEEEYQEELRRIENLKRKATKRMVREMLSPDNVGNAVKGAVRGAKFAGSKTANPYAAVAAAGVGAVVGGFGPLVNYADTIDDLRFDAETAKHELDKSKRKKMVETNDELVSDENQIVHALNIKETDILTTKQLEGLLNVFKKAADPSDLYHVLGTPSSQFNYGCYAPYWSFLASLCVSLEDYPDYALAIKAANEYERVHRDIQKNDPMTADVLIAKVTAMVQLRSADTNEIDRCLKGIDRLNERHANADWSYFCARVLADYLDRPQSAVDVLLANISSMNLEYRSKLMKYRNLYVKKPVEMEKNKMPLDANLLRARVLLQRILKRAKSDDLEKELKQFCRALTTSTIEKLYYVGDVRTDDLWEIAKKDVLSISMYYEKKMLGNRFVVFVPIQWFILGEVESKIELVKGGRVVKSIGENWGKREVMSNWKAGGSDLVMLSFKCPAKDIQGADSIRLVFPHESWPIEINYLPALGIDMQTVASAGDFTFTPVRIVFMGEKKELEKPVEKLEAKLRENRKKNHTAKLLDFKIGQYSYSTNFLESISIDSNKVFTVAYTNPTPEETHIDIDVRYYNRYGGQMCRVEVEDQPIHGREGGEWRLEYPNDIKESENPAYVLFQYHIEESMWEKYVTNPRIRNSIEKQAEKVKAESKEK